MSKTVAVPVELLEELIEQHITAKGFTNEAARRAQAILSAPLVDEPASYPNTGSAGHSIARCSQSHSEAGWCGTDDCYRRNR